MSNTKCTLLGCRYDEVYRSLERMRADFKTVQDGAIELAQELNSRIAKLEHDLADAVDRISDEAMKNTKTRGW